MVNALRDANEASYIELDHVGVERPPKSGCLIRAVK
jgi:hypothetical protein